MTRITEVKTSPRKTVQKAISIIDRVLDHKLYDCLDIFSDNRSVEEIFEVIEEAHQKATIDFDYLQNGEFIIRDLIDSLEQIKEMLYELDLNELELEVC